MNQSAFYNVTMFSIFWAIQIFISKLGFVAGAQTVPFIVQSSVIALVVLSVVVLPKHYQELKTIPRSVLVGILLANAIHFGLGGFLSNSGFALTTAVNAGFLVKFALVSTIVLAWIFLKEKMTITKFVSAIIMLVGSYLISTKGQMIVPHLGDLLIILACVSWSTGNIMIRKALKDNPLNGDVVSFLRPIAGIPVFFVFILFSPLYPTAMQNSFVGNYFDFSYWPYVLGAGVSTALLWIYLNRTLKVATASYMTLMSMSTSIFVAILGIVILHERMDTAQVIGALLTIGAGFVTHYSGVEKK